MGKYSDEYIIQICPNGTEGERVRIGDLDIALPAQPAEEEIAGHGLPNHMQLWERVPMPKELSRIKSMDEWLRRQESSERSFVRISRRSFAVGVRAFGFTMTAGLHILRAGTT